ncbi:hypothetical protein [Bdellovibrio sp.]|uniref:hypothetical protein n=1 Tax=Bdellovibrio sp. TaxID=28201 RepID=UPI0039E27890
MLQFVREIPISIVIEAAPSQRRGFLFHLAAGFSKDVDPLSGMTVNLMAVDQWLSDLKVNLEKAAFISFAEVMAVARLTLLERANKEAATLQSLSFREERGWAFSWNSEDSEDVLNFSYAHYLESFPKNEKFDLLKVVFHWRRLQNGEEDFQHEGFKLLKELSLKESVDLHESLHDCVGHRLASGSFLQKVEILHLGAGYSVSVP